MRYALTLFMTLALAACEAEETTTADTGTSDTGIADTGIADTGTTDTGTTDTGTSDTGIADTGTSDTEVADTGSTDVLDEETTETCDADAAAYEALAPIDAVATTSATAEADGEGWTLTIDASAGGSAGAASNPFIYVDLNGGTAIDVTDIEALSDTTWTLAFKRTTIRTNSGNSGPGTYLVARADGVDFETAPTPGRDATWLSDDFIDSACEVITEGRGTPLTAFGTWYDYDPSTHAVSPTEGVVYFIYDPTTHGVLKLAITSWESGVFTLRVAPV